METKCVYIRKSKWRCWFQFGAKRRKRVYQLKKYYLLLLGSLKKYISTIYLKKYLSTIYLKIYISTIHLKNIYIFILKKFYLFKKNIYGICKMANF